MVLPENSFTKGYWRLLKEGEQWKRFSICVGPKDFDDLNRYRGTKSKSEFFRRLLNMYRKAVKDLGSGIPFEDEGAKKFVEKKERKEVEAEAKAQDDQEKIDIDTF